MEIKRPKAYIPGAEPKTQLEFPLKNTIAGNNSRYFAIRHSNITDIHFTAGTIYWKTNPGDAWDIAKSKEFEFKSPTTAATRVWDETWVDLGDTSWSGSDVTNLMLEIEDPMPTGGSDSIVTMNIDYWGIGHRGFESRFTSSDAYFWNDLTVFDGDVTVASGITADTVTIANTTTKTIQNTYARRTNGNGWSYDATWGRGLYVAMYKNAWVCNHIIVPDDYVAGTQITADYYFTTAWDAGNNYGDYNIKLDHEISLDHYGTGSTGDSYQNTVTGTSTFDDFPIQRYKQHINDGIAITDANGEIDGQAVQPGDSITCLSWWRDATTDNYPNSSSFAYRNFNWQYQAAITLGE